MQCLEAPRSLVDAQKIVHEASRLLEPRSTPKQFKGEEFRRHTERFVELVYSLDWEDFEEPKHFAIIESLCGLMVSLVGFYVAAKYGPHDTAECAVFAELRQRLNVAIEGVREGLPPDPRKRPSSDEIDSEVESQLLSIFRS